MFPKKKALSCLILVALSLGLVSNIQISAKRSDPAPFQYSSLQEAINNAPSGATINVTSGFYRESIVINKTLRILGENKSNTVIEGPTNTSIVNITANNVFLSGFTIKTGGFGVLLSKASNCTVTDNIILNNSNGIVLVNSRNNTISYNLIENNTRDSPQLATGSGIFLNEKSARNTLIDNMVVNSGEGIYIRGSDHNVVEQNFIFNNSRTGICLMFINSTASSDYNIIRDNVIKGGACYGIDTYGVNHNVIFNNTLENNAEGFEIENSNNNTFYQNNLVNNERGMYVMASIYNKLNYNKFYRNNIVDNHMQIIFCISTNIWDNGFEGNYWSDYNWTDFNLYGIGTKPHIVSPSDPTNVDRFPLKSRYLEGDVNHDGIVNTADWELLNLSWQCTRGKHGYSLYADFNQDGIVNIRDAAIIGLYWLRQERPDG